MVAACMFECCNFHEISSFFYHLVQKPSWNHHESPWVIMLFPMFLQIHLFKSPGHVHFKSLLWQAAEAAAETSRDQSLAVARWAMAERYPHGDVWIWWRYMMGYIYYIYTYIIMYIYIYVCYDVCIYIYIKHNYIFVFTEWTPQVITRKTPQFKSFNKLQMVKMG